MRAHPHPTLPRRDFRYTPNVPHSLPPKLISRLAGMLAIGISLPWAVTSIANPIVRSSFEVAPPGSSSGIVVGTILLAIDRLTWTHLWEVVKSAWPDLLGLSLGIFWLFGGVWPIAWIIKRERPHG